MSLEIWIPESAREEVFVCTLCETRFPKRQTRAFHRHVAQCAVRHEQEIGEAVAARDTVVYRPLDQEQAAYWKKRGEEGRPLKGIIAVS